MCRRPAEAKVAAVLVVQLALGFPRRRRRAAYASLSRRYVAELSTTIGTRQKFESEERQSSLDAVGDGPGLIIVGSN